MPDMELINAVSTLHRTLRSRQFSLEEELSVARLHLLQIEGELQGVKDLYKIVDDFEDQLSINKGCV